VLFNVNEIPNGVPYCFSKLNYTPTFLIAFAPAFALKQSLDHY
jgi:hypothetical protein